MAKGLVWAMEELAEQEAAAADAEMPIAADSLETDLLDVNEDAGEVVDQLDATDSAADDADTLEDIAGVMEESNENGGMDPTAARVAEIAVESIYKRLGIRKVNAMPAMESFGSKATRIEATRLAIEGIKEMASTAWNAILKAIETIGKFIKEFFAKLFDSNVKLKARAVALKKSVSATAPSNDKSAKIDIGSLANSVSIGGTVSTAGVIDGIGSVTDAIKTQAALVNTMVVELTTGDIFANAVTTDEDLAKIKTSKIAIGTSLEKVGDSKDGIASFRTKEFLGNRCVIVTGADADATGEAAVKIIASSSAKAGTYDPKAKSVEGKDVQPADKTESLKIIDEVIVICDEITKARETIKRLDTSRAALVTSVKKIISETNTDKEGNAKRGAIVKRAILATANLSSSIPVAFNTQAINCSKSALDYVEKSFKTKAAGTGVATAKASTKEEK